jgi:hypothetical protein
MRSEQAAAHADECVPNGYRDGSQGAVQERPRVWGYSQAVDYGTCNHSPKGEPPFCTDGRGT